MWKLFDYASISTAEVVAKPSIEYPLSETNQPDILNSVPQSPSPEKSSARSLNEDLPTTHIPADPVPQPAGADSMLFDPEAFSDVPEEWILDDWTLFGAPLSAYHSGFDS